MRWDMDAALRETEQPITVFAIGGLVTQEAIDRYGDRLDIVLVDLVSRPTRSTPNVSDHPHCYGQLREL